MASTLRWHLCRSPARRRRPDDTKQHSRWIVSLSPGDLRTVDRLVHDLTSYKTSENEGADSGVVDIPRRLALSRGITLVESQCQRRRLMASELLERSRLGSGGRASSFRLGIAGPPGVGKSSFTEALGMHILTESTRDDGEQNSFMPLNLAVLAIDPSSHATGGSILGDKTRMAGLSCHPRAFVRPSPSSGSLGGMQVGI